MNDLFKSLGGSVEDLSSSAWGYVTNIVSSATKDVGIYLLVFFVVLEISRIFQEANRNNEGTVVPITMLKTVVYALLAGALISSTIFIMPFINEITAGALNLVQGAGKYEYLLFPDTIYGKAPGITSGIQNIMSWIVNFLVSIITSVIVGVIIVTRTIQLYLYTIVAPISFASFASSEYRSIGVSFLKNYFAVSLQGLIIILVIGIRNAFGKVDGSGIIEGNFVGVLMPIATAVLVMQSGRVAKTIVGLGG